MRKSHRKSRLGCHQCKQRKVKCDEAKPACQRCTFAGIHCSYESYLVRPSSLPTPPSSLSANVPRSSSVLSPAQLRSNISTPDANYVSTADETCNPVHSSLWLAERYGLLHLELLDHLKSHLIGVTRSVQPGIVRMLELAYSEGLREAYLMDELLALAAAHKSTIITGELQHLYHTESTKLQTRALAQVSLHKDVVTEDNSLALFAFSTILGQHVLFDIFSSAADLPTTLDKLVQCFDLHQGIRVTAGEAWKKAHAVLHDESLGNQSYVMENAQLTTTGADCDGLLHHLRHSGMDQQTIHVYSNTIKVLQYLFDSVHSSRARSAVAVQEWPVRVTHDYISLLRQRRPEALAVLAYYAVLLHYARNYWAIGDSGYFLIHSISRHLGDYWADWLAWPKQVIGCVWKPAQ